MSASSWRGVMCGVVASGCLLWGGTAHAAPVTVSMIFKSFSGRVGSDFQFTTFFDQGGGPIAVCPNAGCGTGIGELTLPLVGSSGIEFWNTDFGTDRTHNAIRFASSGIQNVSLGQQFLLGTLTYSNGIWFTDPEFQVEFRSDSAQDPAFNFVWNDTIHLSITTNDATKTPDENADFIYLKNLPTLGSIRAYELNDSPTGSNFVTVDVLGSINSLHLERFANAQGGGFIDPGISLAPTPGVPEPATVIIFGLGVVGLFARRLPNPGLGSMLNCASGDQCKPVSCHAPGCASAEENTSAEKRRRTRKHFWRKAIRGKSGGRGTGSLGVCAN